jgi:glutaredoxin-like protein NrdH
MKMEGCDIKLYALSTCIHCKNTKEFLTGCGVEYKCIEVDKLSGEEREKVIEEVKSYNPLCSFPTIVIGDKVIVGFREDELKEVLNL